MRAIAASSTTLTEWVPEQPQFWAKTGSRIAWRTLTITTITLTLSFATWFMMSAIVVRLPGIGFNFTTNQLFWLAAMPGLAGGTLRIVHTFLLPIYGTRKIISIATFIKILPCIGIGLAVMNPATPFWVFMVLAFTAGFGGGDFSSYMPSTSMFFPKRLQGTALGIQAGIGNFGVSLAQFITPLVITVAGVGGYQILTTADSNNTGELATSKIYLQNAAFWYVPLLLVLTFVAWKYLRSVPVTASFKEQLDIFKDKHTYFCTITYVMTFGAFSGLSAAFPLMIKSIYGGFSGAPDPLAYAFYGPLIGSASRVCFGFVADRVGGGILTTICGIALISGCAFMIVAGVLTPGSMAEFPLFVGAMLWMFFFTGIGNAGTFRQFPLIFGHDRRQAAGVIGWTAAVAAYGPFVFSLLIGAVMSQTGNANAFFYGLIVFCLFATAINFWYYTRRGCERPS